MKSEPFLLTLATLGGAIAGFSGLIVALPRPHANDAWKTHEVAGVKLLLEFSFALIFLSLIPSVIDELTSKETWIWSISSLIATAFIVFEILLQAKRLNTATPRNPILLSIIFATGVLLLIYRYSVITIDLIDWYEIVLLWIVGAIGAQFWYFIIEHTGSLP
jgi:hypothetical protein